MEIYSDKFYNDKIKSLVDAKAAAGNLKNPGERLVVGRKLCQSLLDHEDDKVKKEIDKIYEAERQRKRHHGDNNSDEETDPDAIAACVISWQIHSGAADTQCTWGPSRFPDKNFQRSLQQNADFFLGNKQRTLTRMLSRQLLLPPWIEH